MSRLFSLIFHASGEELTQINLDQSTSGIALRLR
jgi:hypothetical protein